LQEGILFHHLMAGERDPYVVCMQMAFDTRARLDGYIRGLQAVIQRHDILRTAVQWEGLREPMQVVWRKAEAPVEEMELGINGRAEQMYEQIKSGGFRVDVRQAPMMRLHIGYEARQDRWLLLLLLHHLIMDHTTFGLMQQEIQAYMAGEEEALPMP